jgi:replicative DNA helicase
MQTTDNKINKLKQTAANMDLQLQFMQKFDTVEFENVILGTLLLDERLFDGVRSRIKPKMFSSKNAPLADVIFEMLELGEPLRKFAILELASKKDHLLITSNDIETMMYNSSEENLDKAIEMFLLNWYSYNKAMHAADFINEIQIGIDARVAASKMTKADIELDLILEQSNEEKYDFEKQIDDTLQTILDKVNGKTIDGIQTGFGDFDIATGGFLNGNLYIIGGESGGGKSTLGLQMVSQAAEMSMQTDFYSLEMTYRQIIPKLFSAKSGVSTLNMRTGSIDKLDTEGIKESAIQTKEKMKMTIIDDVFDIDEIERMAKIRKKRNDTKLIILDHLGIVTTRQRGNKDVIYDDIAYRLKRLAKQLDVPLILLAQKNKDSASRANKKPQTSDLKYGGATAADVIFFPYRPDFNEEDRMYREQVECSIIVTKNRETGTLGEFKRIFVDAYNLYCEIDDNGNAILPNSEKNKAEFDKELSKSNLISRQHAVPLSDETPF